MNALSKVFQNDYITVEEAGELIKDKNIYIIAFTPRSGSSWLTRTLTDAKHYGEPSEWLNHSIARNIIRANSSFAADHVDSYLKKVLERRTSQNNTWGMEITWFQYELFLQMQSNFDFKNICNNWVWLRRKDFVAQGVSLYKAVETEFYHSIQKNKDQVSSKTQDLEYNFDKINQWIRHILNQEVGFNNYFYQQGINPLEAWYEEMMATPKKVLIEISRHIGVNPDNIEFNIQDNPHKKISDSKNTEFINKFKAENKELIEYYTLNRGTKVF